MTKPVITVDPTETVGAARELMRRHGIRHLVVKSGSEVTGVLSDRDATVPELLTGSRAEAWLDDVPVQQAMSTPAVTIGPDDTMAEAANRLRGNKFGALVVLDAEGRLHGIVTETDTHEALGRRGNPRRERVSIRSRGGKLRL
jgi:acetoin utilization protein AcuB